MSRAVERIATGRIELRTKGKAEAGRINFHKGIRLALELFREVLASRDLFLMLLAEFTYLSLEYEGSRPEEKEARASYEAALQDFEDAFPCLKLLDSSEVYRSVALSYPHRAKYRYREMPLDAFQIAYASHRTRVKNSLRKIGFDPDEQVLLELRMTVFDTAQEADWEKQQAALAANQGG
jgi:hypothetical protein